MLEDISCVPGRTVPVFQARYSVCSTQDIPCVPRKTFLVFQPRHSLRCKHDISCAPMTNTAHAIFWRIRPIVPGFDRIVIRFGQILGRSAEFAKKWHAKLSNFKQLKNCEDGSDFDDSWTASLASPNFFSRLPRRRRSRRRCRQRRRWAGPAGQPAKDR